MSSEMVTLFAYAKCSTCREAVKWLRTHSVDFFERPVYDSPPSVAELRRMLAFQDGNFRRLFNTSGREYRALGLAAKLPGMSETDALALLAGNGRLVKRPFLLGRTVGLLGFDADGWRQAFGR
ncbi:MAG: arsenate reductase family protein [Opitutae bacterium]|nr:arsenate reductase family protein [Opitutae bacterium]